MKTLTARIQDFGLVTVYYQLDDFKIKIPFFLDKHRIRHDVTDEQYQHLYDEVIEHESDLSESFEY